MKTYYKKKSNYQQRDLLCHHLARFLQALDHWSLCSDLLQEGLLALEMKDLTV